MVLENIGKLMISLKQLWNMFRNEMAASEIIAISRTKITKQEELADIIKDKLKKSYEEYQTAI